MIAQRILISLLIKRSYISYTVAPGTGYFLNNFLYLRLKKFFSRTAGISTALPIVAGREKKFSVLFAFTAVR